MFSLFVYWKNQQNIEFCVFLSFIIIIINIFYFASYVNLIFWGFGEELRPKKKKKKLGRVTLN